MRTYLAELTGTQHHVNRKCGRNTGSPQTSPGKAPFRYSFTLLPFDLSTPSSSILVSSKGGEEEGMIKRV